MKWINNLLLIIREEIKSEREVSKLISMKKKALKREWKQEKLKKEINKYILFYFFKVIFLLVTCYFIITPLLDVKLINQIFGFDITQNQYSNLLVQILLITIFFTAVLVRADLPKSSIIDYKRYYLNIIQLIEKIANKFMQALLIFPICLFIFVYFLSSNTVSNYKIIFAGLFYFLIKRLLSKQTNKIFSTFWENQLTDELAYLERNTSTTIHTPDGIFTTYHGRLISKPMRAKPIIKKEEIEK